jgi:uncharacterized protein YbjT (DUF2867 family)
MRILLLGATGLIGEAALRRLFWRAILVIQICRSEIARPAIALW